MKQQPSSAVASPSEPEEGEAPDSAFRGQRAAGPSLWGGPRGGTDDVGPSAFSSAAAAGLGGWSREGSRDFSGGRAAGPSWVGGSGTLPELPPGPGHEAYRPGPRREDSLLPSGVGGSGRPPFGAAASMPWWAHCPACEFLHAQSESAPSPCRNLRPSSLCAFREGSALRSPQGHRSWSMDGEGPPRIREVGGGGAGWGGEGGGWGGEEIEGGYPGFQQQQQHPVQQQPMRGGSGGGWDQQHQQGGFGGRGYPYEQQQRQEFRGGPLPQQQPLPYGGGERWGPGISAGSRGGNIGGGNPVGRALTYQERQRARAAGGVSGGMPPPGQMPEQQQQQQEWRGMRGWGGRQ